MSRKAFDYRLLLFVTDSYLTFHSSNLALRLESPLLLIVAIGLPNGQTHARDEQTMAQE